MKDLVLIHGALGSSAQMKLLAPTLAPHFHVHIPDLPGHGGSPISEQGFSFDLFDEYLISWLDEKGIEKAAFFGYSMGGYCALLLALNHPERVEQIVTLGTKFDWNPATAVREAKLLDPEMMEKKIPSFVAGLERVHHPVSWNEVVNETAAFMLRLGKSPNLNAQSMSEIQHQCLLLVGEKDSTAGVEATRKAAMCLKNASFRVLMDTPHPIEKVDMEFLSGSIIKFLRKG